MVAILEQAKKGQAPDLLSRSTGSCLSLFPGLQCPPPLSNMKKTLEARVSSRRRYSCSPALLCWVPCSSLSLQHHCLLKRRPWVNSGVTFHFCSLLRGSIPDTVHLFPWTLSAIIFGSHQSTLECSHLFLVSQISKSNLLTIPETPLHLLTPCSQPVHFCWVFACLVLLINCFPLHLQIFVKTVFCPPTWAASHQESPFYL